MKYLHGLRCDFSWTRTFPSLQNTKLRCRIHKSLTLDLILQQLNQFHKSALHFSMIYFNIILPSSVVLFRVNVKPGHELRL